MTEAEPTTSVQPAATNYLALAREAYSTSTTFFDSSIRPQIEAAIRQFQGVHPNGSKYHSETYKHKSRLFRPKTRAMVRKNEAVAAEAFFSTQDVVSVSAQDDSDKMQQASAEVNQDAIRTSSSQISAARVSSSSCALSPPNSAESGGKD